ncbi:MAG: hypothetical protein K0U52_07190 [Gammaproteobacteria bacterium]|nr:hypothetical protein [Gammaproteobacteria bacterium]
MSDTPGYYVGPTQTDLANAFAYARDKLSKELCQSNDAYTWNPQLTTQYPCPEGLTCESGTCKFSQQGCESHSFYPYYDCTRNSVDCNVNADGSCDVCHYVIENDQSTTDGPFSPDLSMPPGCHPGDEIYQDNPGPGYLCQGQIHDPDPYKVDGQKIACTSDVDCQLKGAGGSCGVTKGLKSYGYCHENVHPYLEWRPSVQLWNDQPPATNVCVQTVPMFRRWCEMPWTRPGVGDQNKPEDFTQPLETRIQDFWKTKARPPFYYDKQTGQCHMTKTYCTGDLDAGGADAGYGSGDDYWAFSTCSYPDGEDLEINTKYDCCTALGQSIEEFFFGKTLTSELKDLLTEGKGDGWVWANEGKFIASLGEDAWNGISSFFSDPKLKEELKVELEDHLAPGLSLYSWKWSEEAETLYGLSGDGLGLITPEIAQYYPQCIVTNAHGHELFVPLESPDPGDMLYKRIAFIVNWCLAKNKD